VVSSLIYWVNGHIVSTIRIAELYEEPHKLTARPSSSGELVKVISTIAKRRRWYVAKRRKDS